MVLELVCITSIKKYFGEHKYTLSIDNIHAIAAIKPSQKYSNLDMSPKAIPTEMIQ